MRSEGLQLPRKPKVDIPDLPSDLGEWTDDEMMELFAQLTQWANYIGPKVALAEAEEADAEAKLDKQKALFMIEGWSGAREERVAIAKAEALVGAEVQDLVAEHAQAKAYRKLLSTLFTNVERSSANVSRELTRRLGTAPKEARTGRYRP